jgi:hypothetical protein
MAEIITLLAGEHRALAHFLDKALTGRRRSSRRMAFDAFLGLYLRHSAVEQRIVYPSVLALDTEAALVRYLEAHGSAEEEMLALNDLGVSALSFDVKLRALRDEVLQHFEEEEDELFRRLKADLDPRRLSALAGEAEALRDAFTPAFGIGGALPLFDGNGNGDGAH